MSRLRRQSLRKWKGRLAMVALLVALAPRGALAAPEQYLTVGDPIEAELRILDLYSSSALGGRIRLPHLFTRPLQILELEGPGPPPVSARPEVARSLARLERVLGRDATASFAADSGHAATPRLWRSASAPNPGLEFSLGIEGRGSSREEEPGSKIVSGSGIHARIGVGLDRWLVYSHLVLGRYENGRHFADPIIANTDVVVLTEETYLGYSATSGHWAALLGRARWHWGPGDEASLLLSRTSAPLTGLSIRGSLDALHLHGMVLNATLDQAAGEQLAAHRVEWQPTERLRLGASEAARYKATGWQPLYVTGLIPYVMVQRLLVQDTPDSSEALRNNILTSFDAAWRIADGTRIYADLAVDDLHSKTSKNPDKIAWQIGWEGAGMIASQRLTWGGEITRIWRYVYTSSYGRTYEAQGRPIGFPTGPDARRVRLRVGWDPGVEWKLFTRLAQTDKGENNLEQPYVPGTARVDGSTFEGVVERTREAELGARWWPAGGVDLSISAAFRRIRNFEHRPGVGHSDGRLKVEVRLTR